MICILEHKSTFASSFIRIRSEISEIGAQKVSGSLRSSNISMLLSIVHTIIKTQYVSRLLKEHGNWSFELASGMINTPKMIKGDVLRIFKLSLEGS